MSALLGRKLGMTRYFTEDGKNIPVTVIEVGPCVVTQIKTTESDGYAAVQLGYDDVRPRRSSMPVMAHDAKAGTSPKRVHREVRFDDDKALEEFELGQSIDASALEGVPYVDVIGTSKGKGFQGPMKLYHFKGQLASHGVERKHRSAGSIGGHASNLGTGPKIKKGKRMARRMGGRRVTVRSLDVVSVDAEQNLLLVMGPVPGPNKGLLFVQKSKRLQKSKAKAARG